MATIQRKATKPLRWSPFRNLIICMYLVDTITGLSIDNYFNFERLRSGRSRKASRSISSNSHKAVTEAVPCKTAIRIHLLSLQYTPAETEIPGAFSPTVTSIWRWKDTVLGNGQDFFIPKPKTLRALQAKLLSQGLEEVVVISNCARLELLVVSEMDPTELISHELLRQVAYHQQNPYRIPLSLGWDEPMAIDGSSVMNSSSAPNDSIHELKKYWTYLRDPIDIARHLCLVAAGMAQRPRRPGRPVPFRPFSSRDAHILLQLKRTLDNCPGKFTSMLIKGALEAGKAVRNERVVPELARLRPFGSHSEAAPARVQDQVKQAAIEKGIDPATEKIVDRISVLCDEVRSERIYFFRTSAEALAVDSRERAWIRARIHNPTMRMRAGEAVDVNTILCRLRSELEHERLHSVDLPAR